jgi:methyl coenzyme M reductase subunit D
MNGREKRHGIRPIIQVATTEATTAIPIGRIGMTIEEAMAMVKVAGIIVSITVQQEATMEATGLVIMAELAR